MFITNQVSADLVTAACAARRYQSVMKISRQINDAERLVSL